MAAIILIFGLMPANSVICTSGHGALNLTFSLHEHNCSCDHNHHHEDQQKEHACSSDQCNTTITHNHECRDTVIPAFLKHFSNDIKADSSPLINTVNLDHSLESISNTTIAQCLQIPQANAPPPHLEHIKSTILLI